MLFAESPMSGTGDVRGENAGDSEPKLAPACEASLQQSSRLGLLQRNQGSLYRAGAPHPGIGGVDHPFDHRFQDLEVAPAAVSQKHLSTSAIENDIVRVADSTEEPLECLRLVVSKLRHGDLHRNLSDRRIGISKEALYSRTQHRDVLTVCGYKVCNLPRLLAPDGFEAAHFSFPLAGALAEELKV